jgi:hypothetical protein
MCSRSKRRPHRFGRLEPTPRRVCVPANTPARTCNGGAPDALLLRHWNSQKSDRVEMQPGVRKKSLYAGDTSDTTSLLKSGQAVNVHVIDGWAKVALDTSGTSEARMSTPVWPSVFANSNDSNSKSSSIVDRIPSAGRSQAHTQPR